PFLAAQLPVDLAQDLLEELALLQDPLAHEDPHQGLDRPIRRIGRSEEVGAVLSPARLGGFCLAGGRSRRGIEAYRRLGGGLHGKGTGEAQALAASRTLGSKGSASPPP